MTLEQRKRVSLAHFGHPAWNKGKKMPEWWGRLSSERVLAGIGGMKGRHHSDKTKEKQRKSNKTKLLWQNPDYRKMMSEKHKWLTGKNNPAYIDGRKPLVMRVRNSEKYEKWIKSVFERDDYTCQDCNVRGGKLEAHHIKGFSKIFSENNFKTFEQVMDCEEMWNMDNGLTLCKKCHSKISTRR